MERSPNDADPPPPPAPGAHGHKKSRGFWSRFFNGYAFRLEVRVALCALATLFGYVLDHTSAGRATGWGLHYVSFIFVSLGISYALPIAIVNIGVAALWFLKLGNGRWCGLITWMNRMLGHAEALVLGVVCIFALVPRLGAQVPLAIGLFLLGEPIIDLIALLIHRAFQWGGVMHDDRGSRAGDLFWLRRPLFYASTIVAALVLTFMATQQLRMAAPFLLAIVGGTALRIVRNWGALRGKALQANDNGHEKNEGFRARQVRWARFDPLLLVFVAGGFAAFAWVEMGRRSAFAKEREIAAHSGEESGGRCLMEMGGPVKADVSVFLLADTQLHALGGQRFAGQMGLADALVPVALRPVELDVLTPVTLAQYTRIAKGRPWAYLGDLTDLGCTSEMSRILQVLTGMDWSRAVGVAPGNHDSTFTGNFAWSPAWDAACRARNARDEKSGDVASGVRLDKRTSDDLLARAFGPGVRKNRGEFRAVLPRFFSAGALRGGSALVNVTPLGTIGANKARGVLGVFVDTSDQIDFGFGIAGSFGTISDAQIETLHDLVTSVAAASGTAYAKPLYVIFTHHPIGALTSSARKRLEGFVSDLEKQSDSGPNVLGLIAAHTHRAQRRGGFCFSGRRFDEIIIGSTTDPPQEGAIMDIGVDDDGVPTLSVLTVPAVVREDAGCGAEGSLSAERCQVHMARLLDVPACHAFTHRQDGAIGRDCDELEQKDTLMDRLNAIGKQPVVSAPRTPEGIAEAQRIRSRQLFECVCRGGACEPPLQEDALDDGAIGRSIDQLLLRDDRREELLCLSWAASVVQAHKANGMQMADALRCAFDDPSLQPARRMTTRLEAHTCE